MLTIRKGNALAAKVNVHRHGWNGTICRNPTAWDCGGKLEFRQNYCERGDAACFHIDLFNEIDPSMRIDQSGADWLLEGDIRALDDQLLLLYNRAFEEPGGVLSTTQGYRVYGAYRIKSASKVERGPRIEWRLRPHPDGWVRFPDLRVRMPRWDSLRGPYIKEVDRESIVRVFTEARQRSIRADSIDEEMRVRIDFFANHLADWLEEAAERIKLPSGGQTHRTVAATGGGSTTNAFAALRHIVAEREEAVRETAEEAPVEAAQPRVERPRLVEPGRRAWIEQSYGRDVLRSLDVATMTKPFLIIRGGPGVGKSTLASRLIDDEGGERSIVVPVASTWRGREDLLGFINPLNNLFQPTELTRFLIRAEKAWDAGDRGTRLVILEELNLSQPEYWLSDVLVRVEYPAEDRRNRTLELGGDGLNLKGEEKRRGVFLTPAVRFVGTINTDHTTKKLSPRVLDRAAVLEIRVDPSAVIEGLGIELEREQMAAIRELDFLVRKKGAAFSYRSALSLRDCLLEREAMDLGVWSVIDLVLIHEVLSKIQLLAGEPGDDAFMDAAMSWREEFGHGLPECSRVLDAWNETLEEGRDVVQA